MSVRDERWPTARLDRVARLRVLAAGLPGVHFHERVIDAPAGDVWRFVSDLERTTALFEPDVQSLKVLERDGEQWRIRVRLPWWAAAAPLHLDVTMRDGWCWMTARPRIYVIGIAAEALTEQPSATRLGYLEGVTLPRRGVTGAAAAGVLAASRRRHERHVPRDVDRLVAAFERESHRA